MINFGHYVELILENKLEWLKSSGGKDPDTSHDPEATFKSRNDILDHFAKHDPDQKSHNYTPWMYNLYRTGKIKQSDAPELGNSLKTFHENKHRKNFFKEHNILPDLNAYSKDVHSFHFDMSAVHNILTGTELEHSSPGLEIHRIKTHAGGRALCEAGWCTREPSNHHFRSYNQRGPLYNIKSNGSWSQFHPATGEFNNSQNQRIDHHTFPPEHLKKIQQHFDYHSSTISRKDHEEARTNPDMTNPIHQILVAGSNSGDAHEKLLSHVQQGHSLIPQATMAALSNGAVSDAKKYHIMAHAKNLSDKQFDSVAVNAIPPAISAIMDHHLHRLQPEHAGHMIHYSHDDEQKLNISRKLKAHFGDRTPNVIHSNIYAYTHDEAEREHTFKNHIMPNLHVSPPSRYVAVMMGPESNRMKVLQHLTKTKTITSTDVADSIQGDSDKARAHVMKHHSDKLSPHALEWLAKKGTEAQIAHGIKNAPTSTIHKLNHYDNDTLAHIIKHRADDLTDDHLITLTQKMGHSNHQVGMKNLIDHAAHRLHADDKHTLAAFSYDKDHVLNNPHIISEPAVQKTFVVGGDPKHIAKIIRHLKTTHGDNHWKDQDRGVTAAIYLHGTDAHRKAITKAFGKDHAGIKQLEDAHKKMSS